jgi:GDP-L-fucose synthase
MKEEYLLTGPLELTNRPYAVAKIAGIIHCEAYNRQHGTRFLAVMPTNIYGPNDNFDLETSHVLPALIRKFHLAKLAEKGDWETIEKDKERFGSIPDDYLTSLISIATHHDHESIVPSAYSPVPGGTPPKVVLWGTGTPCREFLHVDDLAGACLFLMDLPEHQYDTLLEPDHSAPFINIGAGKDLSVRKLAEMVSHVVGFQGMISWDESKPDGTPRKLLDASQMKQFGWSPQIDLKSGIQATYQWYLTQLARR